MNPRSRRRTAVLTLALSLAGVWGACAAGKSPVTHIVVIEDMRFQPAILNVHRGERIEWRNRDIVPHTTTAAGKFDSGSIAPEASWTYVAQDTGTIQYECAFHPTMKAAINIQ